MAQPGGGVYPLIFDHYPPENQMNRLRQALDPFLLLLIATVALASVLPARGEGARVAGAIAVSGAGSMLWSQHRAQRGKAPLLARRRRTRLMESDAGELPADHVAAAAEAADEPERAITGSRPQRTP